MTFDVKVDGELQSDALLHCLLQSWDLLPGELVPVDEGHMYIMTFQTNVPFTWDTIHFDQRHT